jgi:hypothetical protein
MIAALDAAAIPHMLTGSFASGYHGAPRASQDIDLVIAPSEAQIRQFVTELPPTEYYVDLDAAVEAVRRRSQFNVVDMATGWKIDLIVQKARHFSQEEFARRVPVDFQGVRLFVATAEDVVIAKLEWGKLGRSHRQVEDVAALIQVRERLDRAYLDKWIKALGLEDEWRAALALAKPERS